MNVRHQAADAAAPKTAEVHILDRWGLWEIKISWAEDETRIRNSSYTLLSWDDHLCTAAEAAVGGSSAREKNNNKQQSRKYISVPQLHVKKFKYTATGNYKSVPISSINRLKMSFYFFSVFCSYICTTQSWVFLWVLYISIHPSIFFHLSGSGFVLVWKTTFTALPCFKLKYRLSRCSGNKLLMSVNPVQTLADTEIIPQTRC